MYLIDKRTRNSFELTDGAVIGRDAGSDIVIDDKSVSRAHAQVEVNGDEVSLTDLGSSRGTFADREKVESVVLRPGMQIAFGGAKFDVIDEVQSQSFDPRVAPMSQLEFKPADEVWDPVKLHGDYERLRMVYELNRALGMVRHFAPVLERVLHTAFELLSAERGVVQLFESTGRPQTISYARAGTSDELSLSQTVVEEVVRDRKGIIVADAQLHDRFSRAASIAVDGVRSVMCVPLLYEEEVLGVIQVDSLHATHAFESRDLVLFSTIASQAAVVVKEMILREELMKARDTAAERLQRVLDQMPCAVFMLDPELRPTVTNPAAKRLAESLGTDPDQPLGALPETDLARLIEDGELVEFTVEGPAPRHFAARAASSAGETVLVIKDVTELRERVAPPVGEATGEAQALLSAIVDGARALGASAEPVGAADALDAIDAIVAAAQRASSLLGGAASTPDPARAEPR